MIELRGISHRYTVKALALDDLSFEVPNGECFGLIGANGAGKTTTLRILATLLKATSGQALVGDHDTLKETRAVRRMIGFMPETPALFPELTVERYLDYAAAAYGLRGDDRRRRVEGILELVNIGAKRDQPCAALSRGMKQRVSLARALVHDPRVLLLDEPTSGLDPAGRIEFRQIMKELIAAGKTTLVSSHILPELSEICTSIAIIEQGRLVVSGRVDDIVDNLKGPREIRVEVVGDVSAVANALRSRPGVERVRCEGSQAVVEYGGSRDSVPELLRSLVQAGVQVTAFGEARSRLEDVFLKVGAFEVG